MSGTILFKGFEIFPKATDVNRHFVSWNQPLWDKRIIVFKPSLIHRDYNTAAATTTSNLHLKVHFNFNCPVSANRGLIIERDSRCYVNKGTQPLEPPGERDYFRNTLCRKIGLIASLSGVVCNAAPRDDSFFTINLHSFLSLCTELWLVNHQCQHCLIHPAQRQRFFQIARWKWIYSSNQLFFQLDLSVYRLSILQITNQLKFTFI